jgi:general stress protein YciG
MMANTSNRGFASMDEEKQREFARKGGASPKIKHIVIFLVGFAVIIGAWRGGYLALTEPQPGAFPAAVTHGDEVLDFSPTPST